MLDQPGCCCCSGSSMACCCCWGAALRPAGGGAGTPDGCCSPSSCARASRSAAPRLPSPAANGATSAPSTRAGSNLAQEGWGGGTWSGRSVCLAVCVPMGATPTTPRPLPPSPAAASGWLPLLSDGPGPPSPGGSGTHFWWVATVLTDFLQPPCPTRHFTDSLRPRKTRLSMCCVARPASSCLRNVTMAKPALRPERCRAICGDDGGDGGRCGWRRVAHSPARQLQTPAALADLGTVTHKHERGRGGPAGR